jgi:hypothetical protein
MSSFPGRALPARAAVARRPLCRARKEFMSRTAFTKNDFGVDAVLPADLGGAPRATRQHTKSGPIPKPSQENEIYFRRNSNNLRDPNVRNRLTAC